MKDDGAVRISGVRIVVLEPSPDAIPVECGCCHFDAALPFRLFQVDDDGVGPCGFHVACVRCYDSGCSCRTP